MTAFEVLKSEPHTKLTHYEVSAEGFNFNIERHHDWLTTASWQLPDEYAYEDFLRVVEEVFREAEANGYEVDSPTEVAMGSSEIDEVFIGEFIRPLEPGDFEGLGVTDEQIGFVRLGDDLAHFYWDSNGLVGTLFYEKPHQIRSAFHFIAELMPSRIRLQPAELGKFVLDLERP